MSAVILARVTEQLTRLSPLLDEVVELAHACLQSVLAEGDPSSIGDAW